MLKQTADYVKVNTKADLAKLAAEVGTTSEEFLKYFSITFEALRRRYVFVAAFERDKTMRLVVGKGNSEKIIRTVDERTEAERDAVRRANFEGWLASNRKYNITQVRGIALEDITYEMWLAGLYAW